MPKYKVQLHPDSAPFTVDSREALDKVLAFYNRLKKVQAVAYPYFIYPQRIPSPKRIKEGQCPPLPAIVATDAEGDACKSCYRLNMEFCLRYVYQIEEFNAGKRKAEDIEPLAGLGFSSKADTTEGMRERYERAEAETLETLNLINEYRALPEELPYTGAI